MAADADLRLADVSGGELVAGAEIGVHRALAARRDEDHRARRGGSVVQPAHIVMDADVAHVGIEDVAERIRRDLADKGRPPPEARNARRGIGRRAAWNLPLVGGHALVEVGRPLRIDQMHDAFGEALAGEEARLDRRDDVDDRIADGEHVELCVSHRPDRPPRNPRGDSGLPLRAQPCGWARARAMIGASFTECVP